MSAYEAMSHERVGHCWCGEFHRLQEMQLAVVCPHTSWSGAEGPVLELGRWPVLWQCDGCGTLALMKEEVIAL